MPFWGYLAPRDGPHPGDSLWITSLEPGTTPAIAVDSPVDVPSRPVTVPGPVRLIPSLGPVIPSLRGSGHAR